MLLNHSGTVPSITSDLIRSKNFNADTQKKIFSELASFQWVAASEELPPLGQRVLLFFTRAMGKTASNIHLGQLVYAAGKETCYLLDCGEMEAEVNYWMPLPFQP